MATARLARLMALRLNLPAQELEAVSRIAGVVPGQEQVVPAHHEAAFGHLDGGQVLEAPQGLEDHLTGRTALHLPL